MRDNGKTELFNCALMHAADQFGDITPLVMERYYEAFPKAVAEFETHWPGRCAALEASMVENSLYYLIQWFSEPEFVSTLLSSSVIHHNDTLRIPPAHIGGLLSVICDLISEAVPPECLDERAVIDELKGAVMAVIEEGGEAVWRPIEADQAQSDTLASHEVRG